MNPKVILITGCSSGIGLETSILLAKAGHKVYASMRDTTMKSSDLILASQKEKVEVNILLLDVQNQNTIEQAVQRVIQKEGRIDVLINNAAQGHLRTIEQAQETEIQNLFDINIMGAIRCIKTVLPIMRKQKSGHLIAISSVGGLVGQPLNELYCASKFALEGLYESLATYLPLFFNIDISLIEPGGVNTDFFRNVLDKLANTGGIFDDEYKEIIDAYRKSFADKMDSFQTPKDVAQKILDCIQNPKPPVRMRTSENAEKFCHLKTASDPTGEILRDLLVKNVFGQ